MPATVSTTVLSLGRMPLSMTTPIRTGYSTVTTASSAAATRKMARSSRYGRAYPVIRLTVPGLSRCLVTDGSRVKLRIACHWFCMLMTGEPSSRARSSRLS